MSNFSNWYATHKQEALLGAGGIVVTIALYARSKKASSAASTSAGATSSSIDPATGLPYGSAADNAALAAQQGALYSQGTTGTDVYNGLENQILGLQQAFVGSQGTPAPTTTPAPTPTAAPTNPYAGEVMQGSGFWDPNSYAPIAGLDSTGNFVNLPSGGGPTSAAGAYPGQKYFQPAPGVFQPWTTPGQIAAGTPVFAKA